jgi:hypothetical protein
MPYKRPLGYRQAFGIKNKIAKTQGNQFFHILLSRIVLSRIVQIVAAAAFLLTSDFFSMCMTLLLVEDVSPTALTH